MIFQIQLELSCNPMYTPDIDQEIFIYLRVTLQTN